MKRKPLVFLVEDDLVLAKIVSWELKDNLSCEVRVFENGESMLDNLTESPDIVVLDYFLPGANGDVILKKLKNEAIDPKIIGVSAQAQLQEVKDFFNSGLHRYIEKDTHYIKGLSEIVKNCAIETEKEDEEYAVEVNDELDKKILVGGVLGLLVLLFSIVYSFYELL